MKARFKTILLSALGAIAAFSAVTYTSCNSDKCKAIVCAYGGVCSDGACICPSGYEGTQCETISREKFLGVWMVLEKGTISNTAQYPVSLEKGNSITEVKIKNFRNSFVDPVNAYVKNDTMYIPQQTVNNNTVEGIAYIQDDKYYGYHGKMIVRYKVKNNTNNLTDDFGLDLGEPSLWNK